MGKKMKIEKIYLKVHVKNKREERIKSGSLRTCEK
jgi:hypothetical protein